MKSTGSAIVGPACREVARTVGGTVRNCERASGCLSRGAVLQRRLTGCGSGDSTVAKTPEPTVTVAPTPAPRRRLRQPPPSPAAAPTTPPCRLDPCAVNLAAPEIARAVSEPAAATRAASRPGTPNRSPGNYNECAQLSVVIVKANTNADNPNTRAVMFHQGKFIPTGVPDTFGFNGIDASAEHRRHRGAEIHQRCPASTASCGSAGTATASS